MLETVYENVLSLLYNPKDPYIFHMQLINIYTDVDCLGRSYQILGKRVINKPFESGDWCIKTSKEPYNVYEYREWLNIHSGNIIYDEDIKNALDNMFFGIYEYMNHRNNKYYTLDTFKIFSNVKNIIHLSQVGKCNYESLYDNIHNGMHIYTRLMRSL